MKKAIFFLLLIASVAANAQSLKDALYGGKLKKDSGIVIRKTDDLSSKIDTSIKKPVVAEKNKLKASVKDSSIDNITAKSDIVAIAGVDKIDNNPVVKDNNKLWKEFMDSVIITLKSEVLTSKKIKSGTYYVYIDYEIGLDGQVAINNVLPSPENSFLEQQVKERLSLSSPRLNPVLTSTGKPRKVIKKYNFTLTKM